MRHNSLLVSIIIIFLVSCGNNEDSKKDISDSLTSPTIDTSVTDTPPPATGPAKPAESRTPGDSNEKDRILANIDQYLISKTSLSEGSLTIENTLKDATISLAYAEVSVIDASGKTLRTDFLKIENIGPGNSKVVRIPNTSNAAKITSHIVRLKSDQLTDGEAILVGSRYVPK